MNEFETKDGMIGDGVTGDQNHELGRTKELKWLVSVRYICAFDDLQILQIH